MSIYLNQIRQLIALQKVDDEIYKVKNELEIAPKELEELRKKFGDVSNQLAHQKEKREHLAEQEKRLGVEIEDDAMRIKKSKSKLMQVGNSKEYHAMVREMDSLERVNKDREDEKTTLIEEITHQRTVQAEVQEEFDKIEAELQTCEASMQERVDKAQLELDKLLVIRNETAKDVPAPVFGRYEFIRERLSHPVIVSVTQGICSGCNISIPPQNFIELQKGTQILSCPNCQRLMFWVDHFQNEQ